MTMLMTTSARVDNDDDHDGRSETVESWERPQQCACNEHARRRMSTKSAFNADGRRPAMPGGGESYEYMHRSLLCVVCAQTSTNRVTLEERAFS